MPTKGYQTYHGRTPRWKKVIMILLVIILIAACGVLLLQKYQVFDGNGVHLALPGKEETSSAEPEGGEQSQQPGEVIIDEPEQRTAVLRGRSFDAAALQNETFAALQEGERPVLTMKAANGTLLFGSENDAGADLVREKITGRDAVARISCFADTEQANADRTLAVMSVSGKAWRDPAGNAWLNPYNAQVQTYLAEIVRQCADLGFTEIVLDDVQFPNYGRTDRMTFDGIEDTPENRAAAINAFVDAMRAALGDRQVTLSIALPKELLETGTDDTAGWNLKELAARVDRIYLPAADQTEADSERAAVAALREGVDAEVFFVAETAEPVTGGSNLIS